jgi:2-keto-4-pentenoate hydratase/2-oxohepta-3-ene-1,7-dioic acid hydratase in catechol pathway
MKLIRFLSQVGDVLYGITEPDTPDVARIVAGAPFGDLAVTAKSAKIRNILPPLDPCNVLALGLNYRKHADETGIAYPEIPVVFMKASTSVIGPGAPILLPLAGPDRVDYEGELAIVIGGKVKNIPPEEALTAILGYKCANDISARDWQIEKQKSQWVRGKSFDTFCPLGPCLVSRDEIPEPNNLRLRTTLNGHVLQDSTTADMIFDIPTIVSNLSRSMTLLPGTVILTGTPEGVGFTRQPPIFLRQGDWITVEIEGIGKLTNPVQTEDGR